MNLTETITFDSVIARAKIQLRIGNTTEHDDFLEIAINEAISSLGALTLYKKSQCTLDIVDNKAELPKGFQKLLGMRFLTTIIETTTLNGVEITTSTPRCSPVLYVDTKFLNSCACENTAGFTNYTYACQIVNNTIHFNSNSIESGEIQVAYMGLNTDEYGRFIVYADYERALMSYACWRFTQSFFEMYPANLRQEYQQDWVNQRAAIKASAWISEFQKTKMEISAIVNALVADQTRMNVL